MHQKAMYQKAYGIIETLAPLHVGASAGEEAGNLNLIFRDQFTQTGIIPGSSIRGRLRADMFMEQEEHPERVDKWYGGEVIDEDNQSDDLDKKKKGFTEALVKIEYASIVWLPVFCPGQPIVWVTCQRLLERYKRIAEITTPIPEAYTASLELEQQAKSNYKGQKFLFFNLGFISIKNSDQKILSHWVPEGVSLSKSSLLVVDDSDMPIIHDMALYRQSRVALESTTKTAKTGAFFDVEALPEGTVLAFPLACKKKHQDRSEVKFQDYLEDQVISTTPKELYFGGLESIGFGRCNAIIKQATSESSTKPQ
jgi:CRISPR-associated protein Cmr4